MSRPNWSGGIASAGTTVGCASGATSGATTMSEGSRICLPPDGRVVEVSPYGLDLIFLEEALAHLVALRRKEGEGHAAADHQGVGDLDQVGDHRRACRRPSRRQAPRRTGVRVPRSAGSAPPTSVFTSSPAALGSR